MKITSSLIAAATRILTENGKVVTEAGFVELPEPFGSVFELEDGSKVFLDTGQQAPEAFKSATTVWSSASVTIDAGAETSPEVLEIAGRGMTDPKSLTEDEIKSVCASCVAQAPKDPS